MVLRSPSTAPQMWHDTVRYALNHNMLPQLLDRVDAQLGERRDVDPLRRIIAIVAQRNASAALAEEVQELQSEANRLLDESDASIAVKAASERIRPVVRHIHEQLGNERFWPTLFVGVSDEGARVSRDLIFDRCLDTLRTLDVLIKLGQLAGATPSSDADDRDKWRLKHAQYAAITDAKYAMVRALRMLHQELVHHLPVPTGDKRLLLRIERGISQLRNLYVENTANGRRSEVG